MTWLLILVILGITVTLTLWAAFAYIAIREAKTVLSAGSFTASLAIEAADQLDAMKILLPIDGSAGSTAAVREVARCPLTQGSTIELLYVIHSRVPVIPDFPPWAFTVASAHGEIVREQMRHAPAVLEAAATYLRAHQHQATVVTKTVEGVPKKEILREAAAAGADRIVLGSHGRGRGDRGILGSTVAAVAAEARCTVQIARPRRPVTADVVGVDVNAA
jgi:nucleotide-binding universal stress UspA family protein